MTHSAVQVRKRLDLEIWWENCDVWLLSAVMSSISGNMTLDLLLSPRQTPQMWCYKIHYVSLLHFSHYLSVVVSSSHPADPGLRPSLRPSSLLPPRSARGPCRPSSLELRPRPPFHSSFHYQKLNPLTAPHKREIQSVHPPAQWEIWTQASYKDIYRHREKSSRVYFLFFKGWAKNERRVKLAYHYRVNKLFLYRSYKYAIKIDGLLWIITVYTRSCSQTVSVFLFPQVNVCMMTCVQRSTLQHWSHIKNSERGNFLCAHWKSHFRRRAFVDDLWHHK